ncbi:unnamed protein product [Adineta steineri]|uniref:Uncharacterized protein n=1 Tax=Adineta steineri TaxID=433720 RepID=A0A813XH20_9BILA|nr:unnamed protein product [Adineta steineri]CAF0963989.1 unnamed protein product [Adineta steineri]
MIKADIESFGLLDASVAKILEIQMDTEYDRRQHELNTKAKINISEGNLITAKNTADTNLITAHKQAEGHKSMIEQETVVLSEQLKNDYNLVVQYLLGSRIFDKLQTIANGKNSLTYSVNNQTVDIHRLKSLADLQKQIQNN